MTHPKDRWTLRLFIETGNRLTEHAFFRATSRSISLEAIRLALLHGRRRHVRGGLLIAVGRTEMRFLRRDFGELAERAAGVRVVCSPVGGQILTVYRNHKLKDLRPDRRRNGRRRRQNKKKA